MEKEELRDRLAGTLLGTALGDALGLATEGMPAAAARRAYGEVDRFRLLGGIGFVSDDTEQSALAAQALARHPSDERAFVAAFRRSLLGWFARLPWGIGLGTLRACVRIALGLSRTGVRSAGNGAAMRSAVVGVFYHDAPDARRSRARALAEVTHLDPRAVEGARYVAEVAAACARLRPGDDVTAAIRACASAIDEPELRAAVSTACELAASSGSAVDAAGTLGVTGFVVHSVAFATFCFHRHSEDPLSAIREAIRCGGDTDSNAAIVGAWAGALHGRTGLPAVLLARLQRGPFGQAHLAALADDLARAKLGGGPPTARFSWALALARNLALYPVVLAHAVRVVLSR